METQNNKKKTIPKGSFIFCIFIGIVAILVAFILHAYTVNSKQDFIKTTATVSAVTDGTIYADYSYHDKDYIGMEVHSTLQNPSVGDSITVYIDKTDYRYITTDDFNNYVFKLLITVGCIFAGIGILCLILRRVVYGKDDKTAAYTEFIYAIVDKVEYDTNTSNENGEHPYIIYCHYEDFGGKTRHSYVLKDIYTKPYAYLDKNKNQVKIYLKEKKQYRKYRFDSSILDVKDED